jgi:hypothetical protein
MNMKEHILAAMSEQFYHWQKLLATLTEGQINASHFDEGWSIKDVMNHLWGWQQITLARMQAAVQDLEPAFPAWVIELGTTWEENADQTNARIYKNFHAQPWSETYQNWQKGFLDLLETSEKISEKDLLDGDRYPWLNGHSPSAYLIASYDHHQEHLEKLSAWIQSQADNP